MWFNLPWLKRQLPNRGGRHAQNGIYSWHQARVFNNGAQQTTFQFNKALPLVSVIGPATAAGCLYVEQPPQVMNPQSIPTAGLGGLQAGGFVSQPLVNLDLSPIE